MKKIITIFSLLYGIFAFSQTGNVGINTSNPQATLDVTGVPADATKLDGIIAPRISGDQLNAKTYTPNQTGALVYVNLPLTQTATTQTVDVSGIGYYYFDGTKWVKNVSIEPWNIQGTPNPATANTDDIYQHGKVAIGTTSSTAVSTKQLDVLGDFKTQYTDGTNYYGIETNETDLGIPMNTFYVANANSLASATESTFLYTAPGQGSFQSNNGSGGGNIAVFSDNTGGTVGMVANNTDQSITSSIWGYSNGTNSFLDLSNSNNNTGESTNVRLEKLKGVTFDFNKAGVPAGVPASEGNYTFPRNSGTANQVLVTDGAPNAQLAWKDINQIQATSAFSLPYDTPNSGSLTLNDTHHTVRIYGGNTGIVLPDASTCKGRIYILIGSNGIASKPISVVAGTGIYDDVTNAGITSISGGQRYQIQSDGSGWIVIGR